MASIRVFDFNFSKKIFSNDFDSIFKIDDFFDDQIEFSDSLFFYKGKYIEENLRKISLNNWDYLGK